MCPKQWLTIYNSYYFFGFEKILNLGEVFQIVWKCSCEPRNKVPQISPCLRMCWSHHPCSSWQWTILFLTSLLLQEMWLRYYLYDWNINIYKFLNMYVYFYLVSSPGQTFFSGTLIDNVTLWMFFSFYLNPESSARSEAGPSSSQD